MRILADYYSGTPSNPLQGNTGEFEDYKLIVTAPVTPYNITLTQTTGGTITASVAGGTATSSSTTALAGQSVTLTATASSGYAFIGWTVSGVTGTANGNTYTFTMPSGNVTAQATFVTPPTVINNLTDWNNFCAAVNSGYSYSGQTVYLAADITGVTNMAGTWVSSSSYKAFSGTFDGSYNGTAHSISVSLGSSSSPITVQGASPFNCISGATIRNLTVTGNVYSNQHHASGLVGFAADGSTNVIQNCHVSTNVTNGNAYNGDSGNNYMGGLIGHNLTATTSIIGTVYDGTLTSQGFKGGFIGFTAAATINITNSYFGGSYSTNGYSNPNFSPLGVKPSNKTPTLSISRFYYNTDAGSFNVAAYELTSSAPKHAYSVTGQSPVTVEMRGNAISNGTYSVSGLTFYNPGFVYGGTIYGGSGESLALTLSGNSGNYNYQNDHGTLTGSGSSYSLAMEAYDTQIWMAPTPIVMTCGETYTGTLGTSGIWDSYPTSTCSWTETGEEHVYAFTPSTTATYTFTTASTSGDPDFFYMSSNSNQGTGLFCHSEGTYSPSLTGGQTYYLICDNCTGSTSVGYRVSVSCAQYTLTFSAGTGGSMTVRYNGSTVSSGTAFEAGTILDITATPNSGYAFSGWTVTGSGASVTSTTAPVTTFTMGSAACTLTANFVNAQSIPYTENFESNSWTMVNGSATNKWYRGSLGANNSSYGYYISNDNGTSNAYTIASGISVVYIYKNVYFPEAGTYSLSFDLRQQGESSYDCVGALLYANSDTPSASTTSAGSGFDAWPSGHVLCIGGAGMALSGGNWVRPTFTFNVSSAGIYKLTLAWKNDNSVGTQPPASIDNVYLTKTSPLTFSANPSGSGSVSVTQNGTSVSSGSSVGQGETLNITATPAAGYKFNGWTVSGSGASVANPNSRSTTFTMGSEATTLTANFVEWTVNIATSPASTECLSSGTEVTMTASHDIPIEYAFTATSSTFSSISGSPDGTYSTTGDGSTYQISLPFAFNLAGKDFAANTTLYMRCDGHVSFGSEWSDHYASSPGTSRSVIAVLGYDQYLDSDAKMYYKVTTEGGVQVLILEWNYMRSYSSSYNRAYYQVKLYQGSNIVKMCYGSFSYGVSKTMYTYITADGNMTKVTSSYANPVIETNTTATTTGITVSSAELAPANGTVYTFTPPAITYAWSYTGTAGTASGNTYTASPTTNSSYTASVTYNGATKSQTVNVTITPAAPSNLQASNITTNSATVSWDANGASSWKYSTNGGSSWTTTSATSVDLTGLSLGTSYTFVVKAVNGSCESTEVSTTFTTLNTHTLTTLVNPSAGGSISHSGGTWSNNVGTYTHGSSAQLTADANTGYTFQNWTIDGSTVSGSSTSITMNADHTAQANFTLNSYQITATASPSAGGSVTGGGTYNHGATATLTANANEGYTFSQWSDGNTDNPRTVNVTGPASYTAQFTPITYNITYDLAGGSVATANPTTYNITTSTFTLNNPTKTGYTFAGWTGTGLSGANQQVTITQGSTGNRSYTATWTLNSYTLTINYTYADGPAAGTQAATSHIEQVSYNASYSVASPTITGYTASQTTVSGQMPADNVTVNVTYSINHYTVTIVSNNTDYGTVSTGSISNVPYGTAITTSGNQLTINDTTVTATAETSDAQYTYAFSGWSGVPNPATVTGAITITANFTQTVNTYTVSFEPNVNGYGTVSPTSVTVPYGSTFTVSGNTLTVNSTNVTATPADATAQYTYAFSDWSNVPQSVTGNVTVTANFTRTTNEYTVTIVPNDGTYGTVSTGSIANVPYGTTLSTSGTTLTVGSTTVTATPATNTAQYTYGFSDWTSGGSSVPATVTGDITITANFTRTTNEYTVTIVCNNDNYGTVSTGSIANVPYGSTFTVSDNTLTVNGTTVTATPAQATAQYTYAFDSWTGVPSPAEVTGNVTITANFTATTNAYTVTIVPNDANFGSVSPTSVADVPYGTTVSTSGATLTVGSTNVTATPATNTAEYTYAFSGWSNAPQSITDDVTITANFTQTANPYTLTVNYEYSDGTEAATTHTETVAYNATYTVASPAITGYTASQAVVSGTMPAHNETVTVTYTINSYTITLVAGANGSVSGGGTYTYGATCNATANPDNGFALENWTENGVEVSTANPYSFTVTGDRTLTANFMVAPPIVTLVGIDPHVTTVDASGTVDANGNSIGEAGFVWSTTDFTPTVNGLPSGTSYVSTSTIVSGAFSATTTTPMAANTMYYMRAYVRSGSNYYYSDASTYYTLVEVTTEAVSDLHTVDVTFNGSHATGGNGHVSGMGFVYSTTATTPTIGGSGCTQVSLESPYSTPFSANVDGLEGNTDYYVCAYVTNEGGTSYGLPVHFTTDRYYAVSVIVAPAAGGEVTFSPEGDGDGELTNEATIGEGTVEQTYFPILPTAAKSFCEMIYPHTSEMVEGNITKISFHNKSSNGDIDHNVRVYLLNTSATTMTTAGVTVTENDAYYEGRMACDAGGWAEINLTTPFRYDGTSNLMVGVYYYGKNVTSENGAARTWYATTQTDNCSMVYYGANVNPLTLTGTKQLSKNLPNMKVEFSLANGETEWYHYGYDAVTLTAVAKPGYGFVNWTENGSQVSANATYTLTNIVADHSLTANFELLYKRFVVDGNWNVSGSWLPAGVPTATDNVSIEAHATIPSGVVAEVDEIVNIAADTASLKIADGGQLRHNNASNDEVTVTIEKYVEGYTDAHYYDNYIYTLYSSPANVSAADFRQYTYGFDDPHQNFFYFDYANTVDGELLEWVNNYTYGANDTVASLVRNRGYLYASMHSTTLGVTGEVMASDVDQEVNLAYTANSDLRFNGWNLMGNPFVCNAYVAAIDANGAAAEANYYVLNSDGNDFTLPSSNYIEPAGAMMVRAYATGDKLLYSRDAINLNNRTGMLDVAVAYDGGHNDRGVRNIDRARVRFGEGRNFEKLQLDPSHTCVYIPVSGNDYSVVYAQPVGVIPVNFRAEHNGAYTLSFGTDGVTFNYLHLIDNMTGADVDLLTHDSYSFSARMTDYESRFKLVFATNEVGEGDGTGSGNFAFNMNGTWVVYSDGEATLQVVDVLGHILSSERISGTVSKAIQAAPGVYMLRLIQGENVNVQKIVIER